MITAIEMPDLDGIAAAAEICRHAPVPVIGVLRDHDPTLLERTLAAPILACLVEPVEPADLECTLALSLRLFDQLQAPQRETAELRQALDERKVTERAKGIISKRLNLDEDEAYRRLRQLASTRNHRLVQVGQQVVDADQVFQALERSVADTAVPTRQAATRSSGTRRVHGA